MMMGIVAGQMRYPAGAGGGTDPLWASVVSLAHFDADFVDAKDAVTWTKTGSVVLQADAAAFGGYGAYNPGNNNWVQRTIPAIGIQDFTLEFRLKRAAVTKTDVVFDLRSAGSTNGIVLYRDAGGSATLYFNSSAIITATLGTMTAWTSLCVERSGGLIRLYKDGVVMGSWNGTANLANTTLRMLNSIVNSTQYGSQGTPGLLDELRLTIGVACYQGNYTPASTAFPSG